MSDDDAADDLACLHGPEGVVDLVELDAAGDHRTEVAGRRALQVDGVEGEDAGRARDAGTLDDGLAAPATADDGDGGTGADLSGVEGGAHARGHATPDECQLLVGEVGLDLHERRL